MPSDHPRWTCHNQFPPVTYFLSSSAASFACNKWNLAYLATKILSAKHEEKKQNCWVKPGTRITKKNLEPNSMHAVDKNNKNTTEIETKFNNEPRKTLWSRKQPKQERQYSNNTEYTKVEQRGYVHSKHKRPTNINYANTTYSQKGPEKTPSSILELEKSRKVHN